MSNVLDGSSLGPVRLSLDGRPVWRSMMDENVWKERYERVLKGETRHGWQVLIPIDCQCKKYHDSPVAHIGGYYIIDMRMIDPDERLEFPSTTSIVVAFRNPSPFGGGIFTIRQYSIIDPRMSSSILKIVSREAWSDFGFSYLSSRTLMAVFAKETSLRA